MQNNLNNLSVLTGSIENISNAAPLPPFSNEVISFLNDLSKRLMAEKEYSDIVTFAFWIRQASLMIEKNKYDDLNTRLGRGIIFHIAPSNVAINFAFSLVAGLLAGNANIVRLPSKDFQQVNILVNIINELINNSYKYLYPYICMVKYPINKNISDELSKNCNIRVIWGGDKTIANLRLSPIKPRAYEITFADRYSAAVINADLYLKEENKQKISQNFYNDTYLSDQNACTSPRILFWIGNDISKAKKVFWNNINSLVTDKYQLSAVQAVGKLSALYKAAANIDVCSCELNNNYITRLELDDLSDNIMDYKYNSGFFFEYNISKLDEIIAICDEKFQTLTYYGLTKDEIECFLKEKKPHGIDRVVPIGSSMDFSLVWDGHDLIREMSRKYYII